MWLSAKVIAMWIYGALSPGMKEVLMLIDDSSA
jgi:hypothetical protein